MSLRLQGNWVIGSYQTGRQRVSGRIHLRPEDENQLEGFWCRGPSCVPPHSAGRIRFTLAEDGQTFSGEYEEGFEPDQGNVLDEFEAAAYEIAGTRAR